MISKLAVHAETRLKSIDLMINALQQYYITGVDHNIAFLISTLKNDDFKSGNISTNFIKENYSKGYSSNFGLNKSLMKKFNMAAVYVYSKLNKFKGNNISVSSKKRSFDYQLKEEKMLEDSYLIRLGDKRNDFVISSNWKNNEKVMCLKIDGELCFVKVNEIKNFNQFSFTIEDCTLNLTLSSTQIEKLFAYMPAIKVEDLSKKLISPMPGLVKSISIKKGQSIKQGQELIVIEAMKMENILNSEKDCIVDDVLIKEGSSVSTDEVLITFK
jgi:propionyl-CoA carboxylase alpha chain